MQNILFRSGCCILVCELFWDEGFAKHLHRAFMSELPRAMISQVVDSFS